jgi:protease I
MSLHGYHVVILLERDYEDLEFWYPKLRLLEEGAQVTAVAPGRGTYESKHGYPATAVATVAELDIQSVDGVVVPGGWAPDRLRRHEDINAFVGAVDARGSLVAAICHGGSVLVSANMLHGRTVTSVGAIKDDLVNAGATWVNEEVVVDRNLVTSRTPDDLPAFMAAVVGTLRAAAPGRAG